MRPSLPTEASFEWSDDYTAQSRPFDRSFDQACRFRLFDELANVRSRAGVTPFRHAHADRFHEEALTVLNEVRDRCLSRVFGVEPMQLVSVMRQLRERLYEEHPNVEIMIAAAISVAPRPGMMALRVAVATRSDGACWICSRGSVTM